MTPHNTILHLARIVHTTPYHITLQKSSTCHITPHHTTPNHTTLNQTTSHRTTPQHTTHITTHSFRPILITQHRILIHLIRPNRITPQYSTHINSYHINLTLLHLTLHLLHQSTIIQILPHQPTSIKRSEKFNEVLNCFTKLNVEALAFIPQTDQNAKLYDLSDVEVTKAIKHISSGKALCPVEVYKKRGSLFTGKLTVLFQIVYNDNLVLHN